MEGAVRSGEDAARAALSALTGSTRQPDAVQPDAVEPDAIQEVVA